MRKETVKPRTAKAAPSKKEPAKKQQSADNLSPSKTSFFGSLRRSTGIASTSTPKATPSSAKTNDVGKTKESIQLRNKPPDKERRPWFRSTNPGILGKDPVKSSIASLNVQTSPTVTDPKKKRPTTISLTPNVTFRRGQNAKIDGQNQPDNLSRTSSITNLDAEQRTGKGARPRKTASRDRIDKIADGKKNDKKGVTKNNNKLDSGESPYPSIDSLQEEEFLQLRRQLQEMAQEKTNLALQLGEQKGQLNILQKEIQSLKSFQEESNQQLEQLSDENTALRKRLRDVAHSPLSDNEKQQLLYETHHRHHSSAPASIATNLIDDGNGGDITACPTPDWDKHSSSNVSEVSVACLQDKINQMQETHYSTNEELQATLQELTDLQRQLTELQQENERLNEEKSLMFDSLCRQTERLNDSRSEVESLKQLLYREKDETGQYESAIEREQKLVGLLKSSQEEKQALLLKLEQMNNEVQEARAGILEKDERITQLSERVRTLESTLDAKHAEHKLIDQELAQAKDQCSGKQIEINRLTDLLDNARTKIVDLEQDRALSDKSELDELLDNARKEKDALESEVAHLKEQLAIGKNEIEKLKEQVSILQEECKVTRNNARTTQCDLEYKCEKLVLEKNNLNDQLLEFQEAINELQVQSQCQLEDKRQLSAVLSETQRNLSEAERKHLVLDGELQELKKVRNEEVEEWEKFQNDLLTSVRVANDFKTEAQQELQRMIMENKSLREKERHLKSEIEKLKGDKKNKKDDTLSKPKSSERRNSADMENLLGLSRRSKDRPKKGKDNVDAAPPKDDRTQEKKPDLLTKAVKRREKPTSRSKKNKTLSVEEELLLKSLNDWYENIDKSLPEEKLTEEQKVVKKLKVLYEDDSLKERPVAHKPKNQLAISKPLLDSVFLNPKLEEIAKDPSMPTIEEMESLEFLSDEHGPPEIRNLPEILDRRALARSVDYANKREQKRVSAISRSRSYDDVFNLDEKSGSPNLYRSTETEDLRKDAPLVHVQRESSILPSDSVSNPRYSDFAVVVDSDARAKHVTEANISRNSSVNFESLASIVASIPKNVPEDELTSEQRFAWRLKKALEEAETKNTLKKIRRTKRVEISFPTVDSVERNAKLKDILLNPLILSVRRNSATDNGVGSMVREPVRHSKSYQDISFSFNANPNKHSLDSIDSTESTLGDSSYGFNRKSSLTDTFSSAELDVGSGVTIPDDFKNFSSFKEDTVANRDSTSSIARHQNEDDNVRGNIQPKEPDLLYNETINKNKKVLANEIPEEKKRASLQDAEKSIVLELAKEDIRENIQPMNQDLLYNETTNKNKNALAGEIPEEKKRASLQDAKKSLVVELAKEDIRENVQPMKQDLLYNETINKNKKILASEIPEERKRASLQDAGKSLILELAKEDIRENVQLKNEDLLYNETINKNKKVLAGEIPEERKRASLQDAETSSVLELDKKQDLLYNETINKNRKVLASEIPEENKRESLQDAEKTLVIELAKEDFRGHIQPNAIPERKRASLQDAEKSLPLELAMEDVRPKNQDLLYNETINKNKKVLAGEIPEERKRASLQNAETVLVLESTKEVVTQTDKDIEEINGDNKMYCVAADRPTTNGSFKVVSLETDEADTSQYVVITSTSDEHVTHFYEPKGTATYKEYVTQLLELQDENSFSDLTYNETLNKKLQLKEPTVISEESSDDKDTKKYQIASVVPDIIYDLTKENEDVNDGIPKNDITTEDLNADENLSYLSWDDTNFNNNSHEEEDSLEYDYHSILKENKYGVISPLNIRLSYKDVVKEIKTKFHSSEEAVVESEDDGLAQSSTFLDDFFGSKRISDEVNFDASTSSDCNIDEEMEKIFEKYLRTPVSEVITQIRPSEDDFEKSASDIEGERVNKEELTSATNFAMLANENDDERVAQDENLDSSSIEEIVLIIDHKQEGPDQESLENTRVTGVAQNVSNYNDKSEDTDKDLIVEEIASPDLDEESKSTEKIIDEGVQQIVESVNKNLSFIANSDRGSEFQIDDTDNALSDEEMKLLRSVTSVRFSRPLSDFNEKDLDMIEKLSAQYLPTKSPKPNAEITSEEPEDNVSRHDDAILQPDIDGDVEKSKSSKISEDSSSSISIDAPLIDIPGHKAEKGRDLQDEIDQSSNSIEEGSEIEVNSESNSLTTSIIKDSDNKSEFVEKEFKELVVNHEIKDIDKDEVNIGEVTNSEIDKTEDINTNFNVASPESVTTTIVMHAENDKTDNTADIDAERFQGELEDYSNTNKPDIISFISNNDIFTRSDKKEVIYDEQGPSNSIDTTRSVLSPRNEETSNILRKNTGTSVKSAGTIHFYEQPWILTTPPKKSIQKKIVEEYQDKEHKSKKNSMSDNKTKSSNQLKQDNDDEDDVNKLLAKLSTSSTMSKKSQEKHTARDIEIKDGRPKVILRNAHYGSVRSKLEYFSKRSADSSPQNRQSLNPYPDVSPPARRKVKSWAEHFEKRSLDTHSTYEPVYANLKTLGLQKSNSAITSKIEKKPLPVPRSKNLGSARSKNDDSSQGDIQNDESVNEMKMSDCKIISENETENLSQEHPDCKSIGRIKLLDIPLYSETSKVILEGSVEVGNEESPKTSVLGVKKSEKFLEMHDGSHESAGIKDDECEDLASGAESSFSSIAVAGKFEQLDITMNSADSGEIPTVVNESHLNLFHLETPSYDESYLSLFKSPEDKVYEDISGVKRPQKGYFNIAYLGEVSDNDSLEEVNARRTARDRMFEGDDSKPKIIDFVPLDDGTEPVFKKDDSKESEYDTLEREKTFHVLNLAASTGAVKKSASSPEHRNTPAPSGSRMSFSAAKKVFETLLESNLDNEKPKSKRKESSQEKAGETAVKGPL